MSYLANGESWSTRPCVHGTRYTGFEDNFRMQLDPTTHLCAMGMPPSVK